MLTASALHTCPDLKCDPVQDMAPLSLGDDVEILEEHAGFLRVRLPYNDSKQSDGWVPKARVKISGSNN